MSYSSRWRLISSADTDCAATAAAASFLAGLLLDEPVEPVLAPYFRGGYQVEFSLRHGECRDRAERFVLEHVERMTMDWSRTEVEGELLHVWSHLLNVPRLDALEVRLCEDAGEQAAGAEEEEQDQPDGPGPAGRGTEPAGRASEAPVAGATEARVADGPESLSPR